MHASLTLQKGGQVHVNEQLIDNQTSFLLAALRPADASDDVLPFGRVGPCAVDLLPIKSSSPGVPARSYALAKPRNHIGCDLNAGRDCCPVADGHLRHSKFVALRDDKEAQSVNERNESP